MASYVCELCDYTYEPEKGEPDNNIPAGTAFEELPENWVCPICGAEKLEFQKVE